MVTHVLLDSRALSRGWKGVLGRLELELNPHNYTTWIKGTRALSFDGVTLVVQATSSMGCDWLDRRLRLVVERACAQSFEAVQTVTFVAAGERPEPGDPDCSSTAAPPPPPAPPAAIGKVNCAYTFEEYLRGRGNSVALQACLSIVEPSDLQASAVVLFGSPGLGKTHLLHALACRAQQLGRTVACLSAEEFTNRCMVGYRGEGLDAFREELRNVNLLIIDDLQMIPTAKPGVQNELVATMDAIANDGGHVVVASERHPFELPLLERLKSRLGEAVITEVTPFDAPERRAFVHAVARKQRVALPTWAIERIASSGINSVRILLGAIKAAVLLEHQQQLDMRSLDGALVAVEGCAVGAEKELLERVAKHFAVAFEELVGESRSRRVAEARSVAAVGLKERGYSLNRIGAALGGRHKSTMHGLLTRGAAVVGANEPLRKLIAG